MINKNLKNTFKIIKIYLKAQAYHNKSNMIFVFVLFYRL